MHFYPFYELLLLSLEQTTSSYCETILGINYSSSVWFILRAFEFPKLWILSVWGAVCKLGSISKTLKPWCRHWPTEIQNRDITSVPPTFPFQDISEVTGVSKKSLKPRHVCLCSLSHTTFAYPSSTILMTCALYLVLKARMVYQCPFKSSWIMLSRMGYKKISSSLHTRKLFQTPSMSIRQTF